MAWPRSAPRSPCSDCRGGALSQSEARRQNLAPGLIPGAHSSFIHDGAFLDVQTRSAGLFSVRPCHAGCVRGAREAATLQDVLWSPGDPSRRPQGPAQPDSIEPAMQYFKQALATWKKKPGLGLFISAVKKGLKPVATKPGGGWGEWASEALKRRLMQFS